MDAGTAVRRAVLRAARGLNAPTKGAIITAT
jgi:hypothetical protein